MIQRLKKIWKASHSAYLLCMALLALPLVIGLGANALILWRAGEFQSPARIAERLQGEPFLFESGVHDLRKSLKLEIIRERKPSIVAFGSSRPLDFRQEYFAKPFACACQAMSLIDDGTVYAQALLDIHVPDVVLFALDFWWFQEPDPTRPPPIDPAQTVSMSLMKLIKPFQLLYEGEISAREYADLLKGRTDFTGITPSRNGGLLGELRGLGIRADGSLMHGIRLTDYSVPYYERFADIMREPGKFVAADKRYGPDKTIYDGRIGTLKHIIDLFHERGVKVVLVLPPIAPPVYQVLDLNGHHRHLKELSRKLRDLGDEFYDFHDPASIGTTVCEFADQHHAGDTAYMRLLMQILKTNKNSVLKPYVKADALPSYIRRNEGLTIARFAGDGLQSQERDFLKQDCTKSSSLLGYED